VSDKPSKPKIELRDLEGLKYLKVLAAMPEKTLQQSNVNAKLASAVECRRVQSDPHPIVDISFESIGLAVGTYSSSPSGPPLWLEVARIKKHQHSWQRGAAELQSLPITPLRELAGVRSKRLWKTDLLALVAAC
jgi:hypothetical protein